MIKLPSIRPSFFALSALLLAGGLSLSSVAQAQDEMDEDMEDEMDLEDEDPLAEDESVEDLDSEESEEPSEEGAEEAAEESEPSSKGEKKGETQLLIGMRYRATILPKFLMNMFGVDGGTTIFVNGVGPEIGGYWGARDNGFMVMFSPWIAYYGLDQTPFKASTDGDAAWEVVESDLKVWYLTVDAMWDHRIVDRFSFMVGGGFGIGIVGGELRRNEAYAPGGDYSDPDDIIPCQVVNDPAAPQGHCPDGHYNITQGGSADAWPIYPWINFQAGLRYQPIDEFIGRFEMGVGSTGIWFGLGADYSLFL